MRRLFPTSRVARMRVTFWPETLVAYYIDPARHPAADSPTNA